MRSLPSHRSLPWALGLLLAVACAPSSAQALDLAAVDGLLAEGRLAEAQAQLEAALTADPKDDNARFTLGIVQVMQGGEQVMQSLYRYGLNPRWATALPFVRLPVPENPAPEALTNAAFREIIVGFLADLAAAETTLAAIESAEVKTPLRIGAYRMDFNADGRADEEETLWRIYSRVTRQEIDPAAAEGFVIAMDKGDVHWLRGYCHLLSALCESFLAYDTSKLHDYTAQLFFPTAKTRVPLLAKDHEEWWRDPFLDAIAFIHLLNFPLTEPERMQAAHAHLLAVIEQSRASWEAILAETDDDREWIPSPTQRNAALPGVEMSAEMVAAWHAILDELEAVLRGDKLVPFWRGEKPLGVNVERVFLEPTDFDLVLWVQGGAAIPYLEEGPLTQPEFWSRMASGFQGQLFWFAIWVN